MKKYDVHVEYTNAPATDVEDAEYVMNCKDEFLISKGNRQYYCNRAMITCVTVTEKDDEDHFVCRGCAKIFTREYVKKEGMICPDCHLALVPLRTVGGGDERNNSDKSGWDPLWDDR